MTNFNQRGAISQRDYVAPENKAREQALVDSILRLLPAAEHRFFLSFLDRGGAANSPSWQQPEVSRLMSQLMRLYSGPPVAPITPGQIEAERARAANLTRVYVALVPASAMKGERILLVRRASDDGHPLVLLNEDDGTDLEARAGVKAATASLRETPTWSGAETVAPVKVSNFNAEELTRGEIINDLRTDTPARDLAGFGRVRWTSVLVKRDPTK